MEKLNVVQMGAAEAAKAIREGHTTSEELVSACLEQIEAHEEKIGAWAHLDPDLAMSQARDADQAREEGKALGPLHGIPVGVKDIFDTQDLPTEDGTSLHSGRQPPDDATVISFLREARLTHFRNSGGMV